MVISKVVEREGLTVDEQEIEQAIDRLSTPWGDQAAEMRKVLTSDNARRMVSLDVLSDKAIERLVAIAKGEEVPALPEPAEAAAPEAPAAEAAPIEDLSVAAPAQADEPETEATASNE
jgi:FKBP-type peptidyl-prolyl cis-trans isomerase (trigger factor)